MGMSVGSFGISEGNMTRKKRTTTAENTHTHTQSTHLTATASREVTQMLVLFTRQWGLGREVRATSSVLRVRTRLECPEDNLRELMWDSNPNSGITRETKKQNKTKKTFHVKVSNACTHRKKGWENKSGEQAGCPIGPSLPRGREAGVWQPEPEGKGFLQSRLLSPHPPPNCEQDASRSPHLPGILDSWHLPGGWQSEIRSPEETHTTPGTVPSWHTQETAAGIRQGNRLMAHLGQCTHKTPGLNCLYLERTQNAQPIWVSASIGHLSIWAALCWELHEMQGPFGMVSLQSTLEMPEVHTALDYGKTSVVHPLWALPTQASRVCLQCPSLPTAKLNKWA